MKEKTPISSEKPLIVDADGTFLATDMFFECFWASLGRAPVRCLLIFFANLTKRARLKQKMAELAELDVTSLPQRETVKLLVQQEKLKGRSIIMASGSDESLVRQLSESAGLGSDFLASDGVTNLTSSRKAAALIKRFGESGFDYIGDSHDDIAVWQAADKAIAVAPSNRLLAKIDKVPLILDQPTQRRDMLRAMRPHQWVKNVLLFLPLLAAHRLDFAGIMLVIWGIAVFSAAASSIYIVNDLLDLAADRQHETKHKRPFASGKVPIVTGMALSAGLGMFALLGAFIHSLGLMSLIALYMILSLSYSLTLKRLRWVDVTVLATLYTLRVVVGSVAVGVAMSGWLAAFIFPIFLALGCVKRLVELGKAADDNPLPGRGYARKDRADLRNIAVTAAVGALVVFGLYSYSAMALELYSTPSELRLAGVAVALWLTRMIMRGWQGRMDYDPIVFALRDPVGMSMIAIAGLLLIHASS